MKMTSAEANKLLRKLAEEAQTLLDLERQNRAFVAATIEKLEEARPAYSYEATQNRLKEIDRQTRIIKHAINQFNVTQIIPEIHMTIDQALIYIPQLTRTKKKLGAMSTIPEKQKYIGSRATNLIEYTYANFDVEQVKADCAAVTDELAKVQNALDVVNNTVEFEVEI